MRPMFKTILTILAFTAAPAQAATDFGRGGGYTPAYWPGYLDGRSFAGFGIKLTNDLAERETRIVSLADVADIRVDWAVEMRRFPFGLEKDNQFWAAGLADIQSFSASLINILGVIRIEAFELTTKTVDPRLPTPGFGPSYISFVDSGYSFTDGVGEGSGWVIGVPEPSAWGMMLAGFGLVGSMARRRKVAVSYN